MLSFDHYSIINVYAHLHHSKHLLGRLYQLCAVLCQVDPQVRLFEQQALGYRKVDCDSCLDGLDVELAQERGELHRYGVARLGYNSISVDPDGAAIDLWSKNQN